MYLFTKKKITKKRTNKKRRKKSIKKLKVQWIRHCISNNNILPMKYKILKYFKGNFEDPNIIDEMFLVYDQLTQKSDYQKELQKTDFILCSTVKRTLETAMFFFLPYLFEEKIKIVPGICEIGIGPGNKVYSKDKLFSRIHYWLLHLKKIMKDKKFKKVKHPLFDMLKSKGGLKMIEKAVKKTYSDFNDPTWKPIKNYKNSPNDMFINCLYNYLKKKSLLDQTISIISHSKYIKNFVLINYPKNRVLNNEIINFTYEFNSESNRKNKIVKKTQKKRNYLGCVHNNVNFECLYNKKKKKLTKKISIQT